MVTFSIIWFQGINVQLYGANSPNQVSVFLQIPMYFIITAGEVLFSVNGLDFAYSQVLSFFKLIVSFSILHISSQFLIIPHHSSSLLIIPHHFSSFLIILVILIIPHHSSSFLVILIIPHHSSSFLITPHHYLSLLIIPHHSSSLLIIPRHSHHSSSLLIILIILIIPESHLPLGSTKHEISLSSSMATHCCIWKSYGSNNSRVKCLW